MVNRQEVVSGRLAGEVAEDWPSGIFSKFIILFSKHNIFILLNDFPNVMEVRNLNVSES